MDGSRWVAAKSRFFLPGRVLSDLFRGLMLAKLLADHAAGRLQFFGPHAHLADAKAFRAFLAPLRRKVRKPCLPICPATPTASPSRTAA
jgi:hypothetical protein